MAFTIGEACQNKMVFYEQQLDCARKASADTESVSESSESPESTDSVSVNSRQSLEDELEEAWDGVVVGINSTNPYGLKTFVISTTDTGERRFVGLSPTVVKKMQDDSEFKDRVIQNVLEHFEAFDQAVADSNGKALSYSLLVDVDDDGNVSGWLYEELINDEGEKVYDKKQIKTEEGNEKKEKADQEQQLERQAKILEAISETGDSEDFYSKVKKIGNAALVVDVEI